MWEEGWWMVATTLTFSPLGPFFASAFKYFTMISAIALSRPVVGSSAKRTAGSVRTSVAKQRRRFSFLEMPPQ
eukprot:12428339-Heterocapsa_arctica.AAC.1